MSNSEVLKQYHDHLTAYQESLRKRTEALAEAEKGHKQTLERLQSELDQVENKANGFFNEAVDIEDTARFILELGKFEHIAQSITSKRVSAHGTASLDAARRNLSHAQELFVLLKKKMGNLESSFIEEDGKRLINIKGDVSKRETIGGSIIGAVLYAVGIFIVWLVAGIFCGIPLGWMDQHWIVDPIWDSYLTLFILLVILPIAITWYVFSQGTQVPKTLYSEIITAVSGTKNSAQAYYDQQEEEYKQKKATAEAKHTEDVETIQKKFQEEIKQIKPQLDKISDQLNGLLIPWNAQEWQTWSPADDVLPAIRLGEMTNSIPGGDALVLPCLYPLPSEKSLLFKVSGPAKERAIRSIQNLLLRFAVSLPPGRLRFTFIDPIGLGQNVATFMHLRDYDEELVTSRAWSEQRQIEQQLFALTEHIGTVVQRLRNKYSNIEEYNEQAQEIAEPYRILTVFDFPANFSEETARRLLSVAQNGPRCGVYTIALWDTDREEPYGFNMEDLERSTTVIEWVDEHFVWQEDLYQHFELQFDTLPANEIINPLLDRVGQAAVEDKKVEVPFERILPSVEKQWAKDTTTLDGFDIPIGPASAHKSQRLQLGQGTSIHALIVGRTGSGKSTLLHTIITSLAVKYSPNEAEVYLIDFKQGIEFKTYASHGLPHARVIAIESEREFGLSVLQGLDAEIKRRSDLFRATGSGEQSITRYRNETGEVMPRILLLVDEFQEFFTEDDQIASQSSLLLDRLVRQGRAYGIHVILASQTLASAYSPARSTIDQMTVRIALQCSEADSRLILADDNPAARFLSRPGQAIYNNANGLEEGNEEFQVAWLPNEKRDQYLQLIKDKASNLQKPAPIVFEGNAQASIENNHPLRQLIQSGIKSEQTYPLRAYLGEPVAIREPVSASFRRQSGSNLLIIGRDEETARGMCASALLSLSAQIPMESDGAIFYVLDFGAADAPYAKLFHDIDEVMPHSFQIGRTRHLPEILGELEAEVKRRIEDDNTSASSKFLLVFAINRARDLRQDDDPLFMGGEVDSDVDGEISVNPSQLFATIFRDGPETGIHTIIWCDTVTNLDRVIDARGRREFAMRTVSQMNADDSLSLIDNSAASKLGQNRALFYDDEEVRLEKLKPYMPPSQEWLKWVKTQF